MSKFTLDCSKLIKTIRKVQGDVFISMFEEWGDEEFESELNKLGISVREDEE